MNNDDSFNECDELFNLYSSKKVTDTFKAQLKKIAADNKFRKTVPNVNDEDICFKRDKTDNHKFRPEVEQQEEEVVIISESIQVLRDKAPVNPVDFRDDSLDDSIEVISEITPRTLRRSNRLRKKRGQPSSELNESSFNNSDTPVRRQATRGRKGSANQKASNKTKVKQKKGKPIDEVTLEDSPELTERDDDLNPEVSVKVIWKSVNIKKFQMRKFQKLSYIFEQLSKEENIPEDKIMLTFNNVRVNRSDTPDSLNLQVYHFLDGGVLSELSNSCQTPNSHSSKCDSDSVTLKFQDVNKKIIKLSLNKNDVLKVGMIKCSEQLEVPLSKIKFYFDGELLEATETPESLGLENEEVIDIKIC